MKKKSRSASQLIQWVQARLNEWDPIGVADHVDDEYDSYAPKIAGMLIDGADAYRVGAHLTQIETVAMGLTGNASRVKVVAEALVTGFQNRDFARTDNP